MFDTSLSTQDEDTSLNSGLPFPPSQIINLLVCFFFVIFFSYTDTISKERHKEVISLCESSP